MPVAPSEYPSSRDLSSGGSAGTFVVVRHGQTAWSREGRHTGRTDVPLEEAGRAEAQSVGRRLAGRTFSLVLTSPRSRARETCSIAGFGEVAQVCEDLSEWDYGAYEGLTTAQICAGRPGWRLWHDGVVDGEALEDLGRRADRVIATAQSTIEGSGGDVLAFAHGHLLRVLCARWIDLDPREGARFMFGSGHMGVLGWQHDIAAVTRWNEEPWAPEGPPQRRG